MTPAAIIPMHTPRRRSPSSNSSPSSSAPRSACSAAPCRARCRRSPPTIPTPTGSPSATRCSASTASTTTTRCGRSAAELDIAPTFHSTGSNQALRNSPTNFTYNHIGHFADAGHAAAKGIFLGGVTRRFPELRFAFLEGGVGWARAAVRRPDRALGAAQHQGAGKHEAGEARPRPADELRREVRLCRARRGAARARRLARSGTAHDRRHRQPRRFRRLQDHPQGGLGRSLRHAVLFRLRGGRPDERGRRSARATRSARSSTRSTAPISGIST